MGRTRTNIELDDEDVAAIMRRYSLKTKTEAVAMALGNLAGQPMTREEALAMRGANAVGQVPVDETSLVRDEPVLDQRVAVTDPVIAEVLAGTRTSTASPR